MSNISSIRLCLANKFLANAELRTWVEATRRMTSQRLCLTIWKSESKGGADDLCIYVRYPVEVLLLFQAKSCQRFTVLLMLATRASKVSIITGNFKHISFLLSPESFNYDISFWRTITLFSAPLWIEPASTSTPTLTSPEECRMLCLLIYTNIRVICLPKLNTSREASDQSPIYVSKAGNDRMKI